MTNVQQLLQHILQLQLVYFQVPIFKIVTTDNASADTVSELAKPVAKNTTPSDNLHESTVQISDSIPDKRVNLKNDEDYESSEKGDPWDKFAFSEINQQ
jgi:hypothetical protein